MQYTLRHYPTNEIFQLVIDYDDVLIVDLDLMMYPEIDQHTFDIVNRFLTTLEPDQVYRWATFLDLMVSVLKEPELTDSQFNASWQLYFSLISGDRLFMHKVWQFTPINYVRDPEKVMYWMCLWSRLLTPIFALMYRYNRGRYVLPIINWLQSTYFFLDQTLIEDLTEILVDPEHVIALESAVHNYVIQGLSEYNDFTLQAAQSYTRKWCMAMLQYQLFTMYPDQYTNC